MSSRRASQGVSQPSAVAMIPWVVVASRSKLLPAQFIGSSSSFESITIITTQKHTPKHTPYIRHASNVHKSSFIINFAIH